MKKYLLLSLIALTTISTVLASTYVKGYYRKNGTYVHSHYRSDRDSSFSNNWSTYGNTNPYTGEKGWKTKKSYSSYSYPTNTYINTPTYKPLYTPTKYFKGYKCTDDCSGHKTGYNWAKKWNITSCIDILLKTNWSFYEGCKAYAEEAPYKYSYKPTISSCPLNSSVGNDGGCYCNSGYKLGSNKKSCVKLYCPARSKIVGNQCVCDAGYKFTWDKDTCIQEKTESDYIIPAKKTDYRSKTKKQEPKNNTIIKKTYRHRGYYSKKVKSEIKKTDGEVLHSSVRNYKQHIISFKTLGEHIRIDLLSNNKYRYIVWPNNRDIRFKPSLIITDGELERDNLKQKDIYKFKKKEYSYNWKLYKVSIDTNKNSVSYPNIKLFTSKYHDEGVNGNSFPFSGEIEEEIINSEKYNPAY